MVLSAMDICFLAVSSLTVDAPCMQMGARPTEWRWLLWAGCGEASDYFSSFVMESITLSCRTCSYGEDEMRRKEENHWPRLLEDFISPLYDPMPRNRNQLQTCSRSSMGTLHGPYGVAMSGKHHATGREPLIRLIDALFSLTHFCFFFSFGKEKGRMRNGNESHLTICAFLLVF